MIFPYWVLMYFKKSTMLEKENAQCMTILTVSMHKLITQLLLKWHFPVHNLSQHFLTFWKMYISQQFFPHPSHPLLYVYFTKMLSDQQNRASNAYFISPEPRTYYLFTLAKTRKTQTFIFTPNISLNQPKHF